MGRDVVGILYDVVAVAIILLVVYKGTQSGFLRSALSAASYVMAAGFASFLGPKIGAWVYSSMVEPPLYSMIENAVEQAFTDGATTTAEMIAGLPGWVQSLIAPYLQGVNPSEDFVASAKSTMLTAVDSALRTPVTWFLSALGFILLFLIIALVLRQVAKLFGGVNRLPLIGTVNMLFGGLVGVVQAAAWLFFLAVVARMFITLSGNKLWWLNQGMLEGTYVFGVFYRMINF